MGFINEVVNYGGHYVCFVYYVVVFIYIFLFWL